MGNQRSAIAMGGVAKRRPFSAASASAKDEHTDGQQPGSKVEALRRAMLVRGGRSAVVMAVLIFLLTYAVLKYWFVVSGVYYDTLEKVQGCVPRNLEIVNEMLEEEYVVTPLGPARPDADSAALTPCHRRASAPPPPPRARAGTTGT